MKKGAVVEGYVKMVEFPNKGILEIEDNRVVVKNAIPGQKLKVQITKKRNSKYEGRILEVLEASPFEENEGVCPHFGSCGGCNYQSLPYEEQLRIKEDQIRGLLDGAIRNEYEFEGIYASPRQYGYRNKMEFTFGDEVKDGPLALGMHKRGSFHDIVTVSDCRIVDADFRKILTATLAYFEENKIPFYKRLQHTGYLRHLLVRKAVKTEEILVDLVTTSQMEINMDGFVSALLSQSLDGNIVGILHTVNDSLADVVQSDRTDILFGQNYFYEELLGLKFRISPFSFFQTNSLGAEVLYDIARGYIGETKDKVIFDLYSGTGTIAQILAPVAKKVIGVEIVEEAVEAARENAGLNGLENCEFIAGDVPKVIGEIEEKPDLIVLDPPRDGIHPKALEQIIDFGVERLVYISCKPTSLARDLEMLQDRGYRVVKGAAVDLFPGTVHTESIVLLQKSVK